MPFAEIAIGWRAPLAWLIALACIWFAWRRFSQLGALEPPAASELLHSLHEELGLEAARNDVEREALIVELNQRISDVAFQMRLLPATYTALLRICLASGSALALFGFLDLARAPLESALKAGVCALSGLVGAGGVALIGRWARSRVTDIRAAWDRASREVGKSLGTSLATAAPLRR